MNKANKTSEKIDVVITIVRNIDYQGYKVHDWKISVTKGEKVLTTNGRHRGYFTAKRNAKHYLKRLLNEMSDKNPDEVYRKEYTIDCKD